jgi:putative phosphoribosyl transferase
VSFSDRTQAGQRLAERLRHLDGDDVVVLALPRGGVPVAFEVAQALRAALDVILVRKLGVPSQPELGMGAIGEDDVRVLNEDVLAQARVSDAELAAVHQREQAELHRRAEHYRGDRPRAPIAGRTAVVVDDGIATGSTARAACRVARAHGARRVVLAVPVAPPEAVSALREDADEVVCLQTPRVFFAIGQWYGDFSQTSDAQVVDLLRRAADFRSQQATRERRVEIPVEGAILPGQLTVPQQPRGIVVFAHGSGSSRHSPRNRFVAGVLTEAGLGTLLFDLLTHDEERDRANVFHVGLLAGRLADATSWLAGRPETGHARLGYFGASTGAAAALWAAAESDVDIAAVVSRGGRPDLAAGRLPAVRAPTLLIVGGRDETVLKLNRDAQRRLHCENKLAVVPGASHLFEEPGTLEHAATLASEWFTSHLLAAPQPSR